MRAVNLKSSFFYRGLRGCRGKFGLPDFDVALPETVVCNWAQFMGTGLHILMTGRFTLWKAGIFNEWNRGPQ